MDDDYDSKLTKALADLKLQAVPNFKGTARAFGVKRPTRFTDLERKRLLNIVNTSP